MLMATSPSEPQKSSQTQATQVRRPEKPKKKRSPDWRPNGGQSTGHNHRSGSWCYFLVSFFFCLTIIHHYTAALSLDGLQIDFLCIQPVSSTNSDRIVLHRQRSRTERSTLAPIWRAVKVVQGLRVRTHSVTIKSSPVY